MTELRHAWIEFCEDLKGAVDYVFADDQLHMSELDEAEGVQHVLRSLVKATLNTLENDDPLHPELGWVHPNKMGLDNPDAFYQSAPLDLVETYVLEGNVGTVAFLGLTVMRMDWGSGEIAQLLSIDRTDLGADRNGNFSITLSSAPDPGDTGHPWFELPAKRTSLLVRQFLSDWEGEQLADLSLRCVGAPPPERPTGDVLAARLRAVTTEVQRVPPYWNAYYRGHLERGDVNSFAHVRPSPDTAELGGLVGQDYAECWYEIAANQALVVEVEIPECAYWNVQLGDIWGQSTDWVNRQTSLNGNQATLDNGWLRAVLSHTDPGVQNWLDLAGATQGLLLFRWNQADVAPVATCRLVDAADLDEVLPASERRVTADERRAVLEARRRAALSRFRR